MSMKHDISKLLPIYQQMYKEFMESPYTPEVPDGLYEYWLSLSVVVDENIK